MIEAVFERIVKELQAARVGFQIIEHAPVYTSEEAAKIRGISLHEGLKSLVLYADGQPIMVAVPGDRKVNFKLFKKQYGVRDLRMATPEEVVKVTGVEIGAVPPFGHIFGIPLYLDETVKSCERVVFNAGLHARSISLSRKDYETVAKPTLGVFSQEA